MNYVYAVLIGAVIGGIGGYLLRSKQSNAVWLGPALGIAGAVVASILAAIFGSDPGYKLVEAGLQVVLALVGVAVLYVLANRAGGEASTAGAGQAGGESGSAGASQ
jgi:uncharacterized membrane protein YeaQ/YmgE (transglycosylase-associated protein family)